MVDVEARKRLARPVTLKEVKADSRFSGFILARLPRLSVMPVSETEWAQLLEMSGT